ncbi:hypothetical protein MACK_000401 [Theileria orientalis]|uniref:Major facilitator superfamily MFS-1 protein n=1 Tax=Theileria orientalis TaxID=68886 RepID=A0A976QUC0_THEOR|nr:hypothetical protein MACK_000401 [Theileria orientalis]
MTCEGDKCVSEPEKEINSDEHPTPFNLGPMGVLMVFCIIMSLASSLYHNWPAIERIFIDDRVFDSLCTEQQRKNAIPGFFVCDKQRDAIGDLTLYVFFSEFVAFSLCGPLADFIGVYQVLTIGFMAGFFAFLAIYYLHSRLWMLKLACCFWGFSGGSVIIVSVHFARMFPETTSLADGMMIFFENISSVIPIIIGKIMRKYKLTYYQAFGSYVIWGIVPSFLLSITFIPSKISSKNGESKDKKELTEELKNEKFWMNLVVYSIPVTASVFYRKTFSAYFLNNQRLIQVFPIIQLFVFLPTPFIAVLDQFLGIHLTSSLLYVCYIVGFCCFMYPTRGYGLMSIMCFVVAHAAEHQIMHYISQYHPNFESTLMGISYAVVCVVGSVLERIFTLIYNRFSPRAVIYIISGLLILSIVYSIYCHIDSDCGKENKEKLNSYRIIYVIFWLVPFLILCLVLSMRGIYAPKKEKKKATDETLSEYISQKISTISIAFYGFTFYYVCNSFLVLVYIFEISSKIMEQRLKGIALFVFLICFFVLPQLVLIVQFRFSDGFVNITMFTFLLFMFKVALFASKLIIHSKYFVTCFCVFLFLYGYIFFMFTYMLTFYNLQITYAERMYKSSLLHIGSTFTIFILFRFFYRELSIFKRKYYVLWIFSLCFYVFFSATLYMYFSYEMDIPYTWYSANLCFPKGLKENLSEYFDSSCIGVVSNIALTIANFGLLLNTDTTKMLHWLFLGLVIIDALAAVSVLLGQESHLGSSDTPCCVMSILSLILYLILIFLRVFFNSDSLIGNISSIALLISNFVILTLSNNLCWLNAQYNLQKKGQCNCCCNKEKSGCCKNGCCTETPEAEGQKKCTCITSDCKHCYPHLHIKKDKPEANSEAGEQGIGKENGKAKVENGEKEEEKKPVDRTSCLSCLLNKCSKKILTKSNNIVFCFYETEHTQVNKMFLQFYLGSILGWAALVIYVGISKDRYQFHTYL